MKFRDKYQYIVPFWKYNADVERCWVPWSWTERVSSQTSNNSLVIFAPDCDTLHAVKLDYNHLMGQRTQIYGNLWAIEINKSQSSWWSDLVISSHSESSLLSRFSRYTPRSLKNVIRKFTN
jgi:hypothetical protein